MADLIPVQYSYLIPLLPLLGAIAAGSSAKWLKEKSHWPIWIGVGCSAILSIWRLVGDCWVGVSSRESHLKCCRHYSHTHVSRPKLV